MGAGVALFAVTGARADYDAPKPAKGEIMAIRIYNRVLTADERLLNAKLDAIRFLGEPTPAAPGLMILLR